MQDVEGTAVRLRILPARGSPSGLLLLSHVGSSLASTGVCDRWSASKKLRQMRQRRDIRRVATGHPQAGQWAGEWLEQQGSAFRKIQQQEQGLEELVARARRELEGVGQQWWTPGHSGRHCTC